MSEERIHSGRSDWWSSVQRFIGYLSQPSCVSPIINIPVIREAERWLLQKTATLESLMKP